METRPGFVKSVWLSEAEALLAQIIQNFSEKPNTFSYACSEFRMEYFRVGAALCRERAAQQPQQSEQRR